MSWSSWFRINSRMVPRLKIGRLVLGGDAAHIHSPAGAQGMNTGIQDMINLGWKLALVMQGKAAATLIDTYEQDRLPVMRDVLFKTENLTGVTGVIGAANRLLRAVFNQLGPYIGGSALVQANSTARMSQLAPGYRDSPLSENHAHDGSLHAGDRVPELSVRHRTAAGWQDAARQALLDPCYFTLLVVHGIDADTLDPALHAAAHGGALNVKELSPPSETGDRMQYETILGRASVYLVRPDGYVGLAAGAHTAAAHLAVYRRQRFIAAEAVHAN